MQQTSARHSTKTGTHNSRASTPSTATQSPYKSSNISLNVHAKKNLRLAYYTEWDSEIHLTAFRKRLDDDQIRIKRFGLIIPDKDKLQFYLKQMYASNHFDKKEMTEWENKPIAIKGDFDEAKLYFKGLVKDYEVYAQNSGSTAGKHNFESANQSADADAGDEL